jgi:hypothetical protein
MTRLFLKFLLILFFSAFRLNGQVSENYLKSVYLIKIANNFNWELSTEAIKIGVYSKKKEFCGTLEKYAEKQNIGGRPITVTLLQSTKTLSYFDIIYIGEENNKALSDCKKDLKGSRTLIFTNKAPDLQNSMINFYQNYDQRIKFKINLPLLREHELEPSNSMLVGVGSDNDLLSRFNENDSSIILERNLAHKLKAQNLEQKDLLKKIELKMNSIKKSLQNKNTQIKNKSIEIEQINRDLYKQKKKIRTNFKKD